MGAIHIPLNIISIVQASWDIITSWDIIKIFKPHGTLWELFKLHES